MLAETYDWAAKILGPLGRSWSRAKDHRIADAKITAELQVANVDCSSSLKAAHTEIDHLKKEIAKLYRMRDEDYWNRTLQAQVQQLYTAVRAMSKRADIFNAYLGYDADWHARARIAWNLQLPREQLAEHLEPCVSFLEFEKRWLEERREAEPWPNVPPL